MSIPGIASVLHGESAKSIRASDGDESQEEVPFSRAPGILCLLLNQTSLCSPVYSKVNLLTPGCGEGKCSVYCRCQTKSPGQLMLKNLNSPMGFREAFLLCFTF